MIFSPRILYENYNSSTCCPLGEGWDTCILWILTQTHLSAWTINISGFSALLLPQGNTFICTHLLSFFLLSLSEKAVNLCYSPVPLGVEGVGGSRAFLNS